MLIDTHAHLDQEEFAADRCEVLQRARQVGVSAILAVGITAESSEQTVRLAEEHRELYAAVGIHPNYCGQAAGGDWSRIEGLIMRRPVVAIGETGLDRHWDFTPLATQQEFFDRHLLLSQRTDRPVVIHCREAETEVLDMLRAARGRGPLRGVMHAFGGSLETAQEAIELGLHVSFAGSLTFKKSDVLRAVASELPGDRILIETDSPYLSPQPLRGRRNEPAHIVHTAQCLADVRGTTFDQIAAQTSENARRLFGLAEA